MMTLTFSWWAWHLKFTTVLQDAKTSEVDTVSAWRSNIETLIRRSLMCCAIAIVLLDSSRVSKSNKKGNKACQWNSTSHYWYTNNWYSAVNYLTIKATISDYKYCGFCIVFVRLENFLFPPGAAERIWQWGSEFPLPPFLPSYPPALPSSLPYPPFHLPIPPTSPP